MATNQTGIAIVIKAFLPMGKTLDDQLAALTLVKKAHESGDYSGVLAVANIEDVKAEQKTRRVDDAAPATVTATEPDEENRVPDAVPDAVPDDAPDAGPYNPDDDAPKFLKNRKPPKT